MRSRRRDRASGKADTLAGRLLEAFSKLTGDRKAGAKGKAARARGSARKGKGEAKRWAR
jgi:uncharacterized protein YjbJ (UPF0337 family)